MCASSGGGGSKGSYSPADTKLREAMYDRMQPVFGTKIASKIAGPADDDMPVSGLGTTGGTNLLGG